MRFCCKAKEVRRQAMYEKALDACATSPFAQGVSSWILAGEPEPGPLTRSHCISGSRSPNLQNPGQ